MWKIVRQKKKGHTLTDTDRIRSARTRALRAKIRQLNDEMDLLSLQAEYDELREDLGFYDEDSRDRPEDTFMNMLQKLIMAKVQQPAPQHTTELTDKQILEYLSKIPPAWLKKVKKYSEPNKRAIIKQYIAVDKKTEDKIIQYLDVM